METVNLHTDLLTNIFEKQIAICDLADQLANEFDDIKSSDRSKAVAIVDLAGKQKEHLNELETKLDSLFPASQEENKTDQPAWMDFPIEEIKKLTEEDIDFALQIQSMGQEARDFAIFSVMSRDATARRIARGDDLKPQDYKSLYIEREDKLQSCIRTLEEIKAVADLLAVATADGDCPPFFDETLEHIGCLIIDRVTFTMDKINTKPVVSEEVQS